MPTVLVQGLHTAPETPDRNGRLRLFMGQVAIAVGAERKMDGFHMSGNVYEWTLGSDLGFSIILRYIRNRYVLRGGSWRSVFFHAMCIYRSIVRETRRTATIGFRCAKNL